METTELTSVIREAADTSSVADLVAAIAVQPTEDEDGDEYLKVEISLRPRKRDVVTELRGLIRRIEDLVAERDSRYPSVRFLDAA